MLRLRHVAMMPCLVSFALLWAPENARADDTKPNDGWEYVATTDGVVVYRKPVEGSPLVAFKGVAYANLSIGKLLAIFQDPSQRKHWIDRYVEHETFERTRETETYWIHFGLPWPVSDRDYVLNAVGAADSATRTYRIEIKSVTTPKKGPDTCCVRAIAQRTFYEFTALPGEQKTKIVVEVHTDPRGALPSWLVNLIQKSWPSRTLSGLIRRATETQVDPIPELVGWHDPSMPVKPSGSAIEKDTTPRGATAAPQP